MGNGMMTVFMILAAFIGIGTILMGIWIIACLYKINKRLPRLRCSCGKTAVLYNNENGPLGRTIYAYMCECGVKGFIGANKEEAFYGWELRGNKDAYFKYISAKNKIDR